MKLLRLVLAEFEARGARLMDWLDRSPEWVRTVFAFGTLGALGVAVGQLWNMQFGHVVLGLVALSIGAAAVGRWRWGMLAFVGIAGTVWILFGESTVAAAGATGAVLWLTAMLTLPRPVPHPGEDRDSSEDRIEGVTEQDIVCAAGGLVSVARTFAGVVEPSIKRQFPDLISSKQGSHWPFFCTVAGAWTSCAALYRTSLPHDDRTKVERLVRRELVSWNQAADAAYDDLGDFVMRSVARVALDEERRQAFRVAIGQWIVASMTTGKTIRNEGSAVDYLSEILVSEFGTYWEQVGHGEVQPRNVV